MRVRLCAAVAVISVAAAQPQGMPRLDPVHWSAEAQRPTVTHAGSRFAVLLHATIDPGWHLYALQERDALPLATEIAIARTSTADLLQVSQARPQRTVDPASHVMTAWFTREALFTLWLAGTTVQASHDLQVLVRYQACNDRMCLPVRNVTVPVQPATVR